MNAVTTVEARPEPSPSDASLCEAAQAGDSRAFETLVVRHQGLVFGVALGGTGDRTAAEDIAQEVFLVAWRELPSLRDPARFRAWLAGIARNRVREARRRVGREQVSDAVDVPAEIGDPEQALAAAESEQLLWSELSRMPALYREPLVLHYQEDLDTRAIAEALGIAEAAARKRLSRGRDRLRDRVEKNLSGALRKHRPGVPFTAAVVASLASRGASAAKLGWLALAGVAVGAVAVGTAVTIGGGDESPAASVAMDAAPTEALVRSAPPIDAAVAAVSEFDAAPAKPVPDQRKPSRPRRPRRRVAIAPKPQKPQLDAAPEPEASEVRTVRTRVAAYTVRDERRTVIRLSGGENRGIALGWRGHLHDKDGKPLADGEFEITRVTRYESIAVVGVSAAEVRENLYATLRSPN